MKRIYVFMLIISLLLCCAGCDTYAMMDRYPWDKATVWHCEELDFEIRFTENEHGNLASEITTLVYNGKTYEINTAFQAGYFTMIWDKGQETVSEDDILVSGQWKYKNGNMVVEITDDKIFGGAFEELIFKPVSSSEN